MTGFDYVVFLIVAVCAVGGFFRGFVEEVLSLIAWCVGLFAVRYGHEPLTHLLAPYLKNETGAGVLAFAILTIVPFFAAKMLASSIGRASRNSVLGPIDRLLGFGFGAIKGFVIMVLGFSLLVFGYDIVWGPDGRPTWISAARTYPFLNAASEELMTIIDDRRVEAAEAARQAQADKDSELAKATRKAARKAAQRALERRISKAANGE
ncbi:MAG: CvpA family protein [Novosphingobium sp.]|nr:CvpA family protein [Novosphingobium sp.]